MGLSAGKGWGSRGVRLAGDMPDSERSLSVLSANCQRKSELNSCMASNFKFDAKKTSGSRTLVC